MSQTIGTVLVIPSPGPAGPKGDPGDAGTPEVTNASVVAAIASDKAAIWTSLGVPSYANLTAANVALTIGQTFYNTTSGKLEIATA